MPLCQIHISKKASELKDGAELRIANLVASTLKKPVERVTVIVVPDARIVNRGTTDPALTITIKSIAVFDAARNRTYSPAIKKGLSEEFEIPEERCVIIYQDLDKDFLG